MTLELGDHDCDVGTLTFSKNGKLELGFKFEDIPLSEPIYPAVVTPMANGKIMLLKRMDEMPAPKATEEEMVAEAARAAAAAVASEAAADVASAQLAPLKSIVALSSTINVLQELSASFHEAMAPVRLSSVFGGISVAGASASSTSKGSPAGPLSDASPSSHKAGSHSAPLWRSVEGTAPVWWEVDLGVHAMPIHKLTVSWSNIARATDWALCALHDDGGRFESILSGDAAGEASALQMASPSGWRVLKRFRNDARRVRTVMLLPYARARKLRVVVYSSTSNDAPSAVDDDETEDSHDSGAAANDVLKWFVQLDHVALRLAPYALRGASADEYKRIPIRSQQRVTRFSSSFSGAESGASKVDDSDSPLSRMYEEQIVTLHNFGVAGQALEPTMNLSELRKIRNCLEVKNSSTINVSSLEEMSKVDKIKAEFSIERCTPGWNGVPHDETFWTIESRAGNASRELGFQKLAHTDYASSDGGATGTLGTRGTVGLHQTEEAHSQWQLMPAEASIRSVAPEGEPWKFAVRSHLYARAPFRIEAEDEAEYKRELAESSAKTPPAVGAVTVELQSADAIKHSVNVNAEEYFPALDLARSALVEGADSETATKVSHGGGAGAMWDEDNKSSGVVLKDDGKVAKGGRQSDYAAAVAAYHDGVASWTLVSEKDNSNDEHGCIGCCTGVVTNGSYTQASTSKEMWVLRCYNGQLYCPSGSSYPDGKAVIKFHQGDVGFFELDIDAGTLHITVNDGERRILFNDISTEKGPIHPFCCFYGDAEIRITDVSGGSVRSRDIIFPAIATARRSAALCDGGAIADRMGLVAAGSVEPPRLVHSCSTVGLDDADAIFNTLPGHCQSAAWEVYGDDSVSDRFCAEEVAAMAIKTKGNSGIMKTKLSKMKDSEREPHFVKFKRIAAAALITCPSNHRLVSVTDQKQLSNGWACDARQSAAGGCKRGCTGFKQSAGWGRFRCKACDYDLCDMCYAAAGGIASSAGEASSVSVVLKLEVTDGTPVSFTVKAISSEGYGGETSTASVARAPWSTAEDIAFRTPALAVAPIVTKHDGELGKLTVSWDTAVAASGGAATQYKVKMTPAGDGALTLSTTREVPTPLEVGKQYADSFVAAQVSAGGLTRLTSAESCRGLAVGTNVFWKSNSDSGPDNGKWILSTMMRQGDSRCVCFNEIPSSPH